MADHVPGKVLTIGMAMEWPYPGWITLHCGDYKCGHKVTIDLLPFAEKWGKAAPLEKIAKNARCKQCGHKGGSIIIPELLKPK